jgi:hypothetical protein
MGVVLVARGHEEKEKDQVRAIWSKCMPAWREAIKL